MRLPLLSAAGLLAFVAGCSADVPPAPLTDQQLTRECLAAEPINHSQPVGTPVERIIARNGGDQARVYVSEADNWISVCLSDSTGLTQVFGTATDFGPDGPITLFGADDAVLKPRVVLGRLPAGATRIDAVLTSGEQVAGVRDGDIFLIWAPGRTVGGARLTATAPDGAIIAGVTAPPAGTP